MLVPFLLTLLLTPPPALDLVWVPAGTFKMGSDHPDARPDERPPHDVHVDGFFIGATEVTNAQFKVFVDATGWVTVAERPVDWNALKQQVPPGTPKPDDALLQPGSMVFSPPAEGTSSYDIAGRWHWVPGASWVHPEGPGSSITDRMNHPVVHVAWDDAVAFARWHGGTLPTEAQWERAARGGLPGARFAWGNDDITPAHANTWQGTFPTHNTAQDGHVGTAPVRSFPQNGWGLHDMAGNVWEWTADRYDAKAWRRRAAAANAAPINNPTGPATAADPRNPHARNSRTHRGGSFLCHASYCSSYRPSARMGTTPDSALSHLGFRIVIPPDSPAAPPEPAAARKMPAHDQAPNPS